MQQTYLDINKSLTRVKESAGIDLGDVSRDPFIKDLLTDSAGVTSTQILVFRPYFVAAKTLEQDISKQQLKKAGDAEFTNLVPVINSLYNQQAGLDLAYALIIPSGMEAPIIAIAGAETNQTNQRRRVVFNSLSLPIRTVF